MLQASTHCLGPTRFCNSILPEKIQKKDSAVVQFKTLFERFQTPRAKHHSTPVGRPVSDSFEDEVEKVNDYFISRIIKK